MNIYDRLSYIYTKFWLYTKQTRIIRAYTFYCRLYTFFFQILEDEGKDEDEDEEKREV